MATLLSEIPGLKNAVAKAAAIEDAYRRRPFFAGAARICRVPVLPFTPRHFILLDEARSPLLFGGDVGPEHVAQFLWVVSREFLLPTHFVSLREVVAARRRFVGTIATVRFGAALKAIGSYLDAALFDAPRKGEGERERPTASLAAALIDEFASEYGWLPEVLDARGQPIHGAGILDMPFAMFLQCRRLIRQRRDPECYVGNPLSDEAERAAIRRDDQREKRRADNRRKK